MDLTPGSPTNSVTGLTAGSPTAILITGPGTVAISIKDGNDDPVLIYEGRSPGIMVPVLVGTEVSATLKEGASATVTVQQSA